MSRERKRLNWDGQSSAAVTEDGGKRLAIPVTNSTRTKEHSDLSSRTCHQLSEGMITLTHEIAPFANPLDQG